MKQITFFPIILFCILTSLISTSQTLQSENFDGLTLGNVGTDISGSTIGSGGLLTFTDSGQNSDFQIIDSGGSLNNVLQITGTDTDTGSKFLWKDELSTAWASRNSGNDILQVEYNFFTGSNTTSKNIGGVELYDTSFNTIAGFRFTPETKTITGLVYFNNGGDIGTYLVNLGAGNTEIVLNENTWYRVGFAFNKTTGEVIWRGADFYVGINGAATGFDPFEVDFTLYPGSLNGTSSISYFDDFGIKAVTTENLLNISNKELSKTIKLYPNPAKDNINLSIPSDMTLSKIEISDANGRIIKTLISERNLRDNIDLSELSSGLYIINVFSTKGKASKKFMKL